MENNKKLLLEDLNLSYLKAQEILLPEEIYLEHLQLINNIDFTLRQVDVIACELVRFTAKETAQFLSNKTKSLGDSGIESHRAIIRTKINDITRDIEQFAKKSDKYDFLKLYYSSLVIRKEFEKLLEENLAKLFKHIVPSFCIVSKDKGIIVNSNHFTQLSEVARKESLLFKNLEDHLNYISHDVIVQVKQNYLNSSIDSTSSEKQYVIYLVSRGEIEFFEKKNNININLDKDSSIINKHSKNSRNYINDESSLHNKDNKTHIFLLQDEKDKVNITSDFGNYKYIDITRYKNYYSLFFEILRQLFPAVNISEVISQFKLSYENQHASHLFLGPLISNQVLKKDIIKIKTTSFFKKHKLLIIFSFIILATAIFSLVISYHSHQASDEQLNIFNLQRLTVQEILPKYYEGLSTRNLTKEEVEKNYMVVEQFSEVIHQIESGDIWKTFDIKGLPQNKFITCIYNLNAISCYYLFHEHDAEKAEKILRYAKALAEHYISKRSKLQIDFDKLTPAEIYTELAIIKDLPEMYAITTYFLGRCYLFRKNIELAEKYFTLSQYLGDKLNLFEGVLSVINGLVMLKGEKADFYIKKGEFEQARQALKECIETYQIMKRDNKRYKKNFRPNNRGPVSIIPAEDIHHLIDCSRRIIKLYTKLISVTDSKNDRSNRNDKDNENDRRDKKEYLAAVANEFIGSNNDNNINSKNGDSSHSNKSTGILPLIESNDIEGRIIPDSYNSLGFFLLGLYDRNIDFKELKHKLSKKLNMSNVSISNVGISKENTNDKDITAVDITNSDDLEFIYQLFDLSKSLSRNTEYAKADAYDGLAKACERMIIRPNITKEERGKLSLKIQDFKEARDVINKELGRGVTN